MCFSRMSQSQLEQMEMAKIVQILGRNHFHRTINAAVSFLAEQRKKKGLESLPGRVYSRRDKSGSIKMLSPQPHTISNSDDLANSV